MPERRDPRREQPTLELEAVKPPEPGSDPPPSWAIALQHSVNQSNGTLKKMDAEVEQLGTLYSTINDRMHRAERRQDEFESWRARASERVRGESKTNLEQDAAIGTIAADVREVKKAIADNTALTNDIKQGIASALKSPTVKSWATRLGTLTVAVAAAGLLYLQATLNAKVAAIDAKPANTVLVPVPAPTLERTMHDAGSER